MHQLSVPRVLQGISQAVVDMACSIAKETNIRPFLYLGGLFLWIVYWMFLVPRYGDSQAPREHKSWIPMVGNAISFALDTPRFLSKVILSSNHAPVCLNLLRVRVDVVSKPEHIKAVWREPDLHTRAYKSLSLVHMFKIPKHTLKFLQWENSGIQHSPHIKSAIPAHLRMDYLTYQSAHKFLTGPSLKPFTLNFALKLENHLSQTSHISGDWTRVDDLFGLVRTKFSTAAIQALCGERILELNPTFVEDLWTYSENIHIFVKGYPRLLNRQAYNARDKCHAAMKLWHSSVQEQLFDEDLAGVVWNSYYGSSIIRARHQGWSRMPAVDADAAASEDMGLIWATNGNSVPTTFWMLYEILKRPDLLSQVIDVIDRYKHYDIQHLQTMLDWDGLCNEPLLLSIYAETMRTKVASILLRSPDWNPLHLDHWKLVPDSILMISGWHAQTNRSVWEHDGGRPVEEFWPDRFLVETMDEKHAQIDEQSIKKTPKQFSMGKYQDFWLPYGGGRRMCPGRKFNLQEMIGGVMTFLSLFEVELSDEAKAVECDFRGFGTGALLPKTKVAVNIRRRSAKSDK